MLSIGMPSGRNSQTCGYHTQSGQRSESSSFCNAAGLHAYQLSCEVYQMMIDRGWRRSGEYCYKPHLRSTCCPPYTIKLDASAFKPSKHHKKLVNRWNKFVQHAGTQKQSKQRGRENAEFDLISAVHASEYQSHQDPPLTHRYEMTLEPSSYTDEKYQLFQKYQAEIHHDPSTSGGFNRFLVESPLFQEAIPYTSPPPDHLPTHYGSYHWCYRLDGELIAISVIDILPTCVSSVYFMYDKEYEAHSLGKLSALREIALTQELHRAGAPSLNFLYLGYYIHSCQKMRYKGEYQPSYLSDPVECLSAHCFDWECQLKLKFFQETHEWHPFGECSKLLNEFRYACFSHPERSIRGEPGSELVQEFKEYDPHEQDFEDIIGRVCVVSDISGARVSVRSAKLSPEWSSPVYKNQLLSCVEELGGELASRILFQL